LRQKAETQAGGRDRVDATRPESKNLLSVAKRSSDATAENPYGVANVVGAAGPGLPRRARPKELMESLSNEELFQIITEHSRDLICLLDLDGHFVYTSPSFQDVLGWKEGEVLGKKCSDTIHPEDTRGFRDTLDTALFFRESRQVEMRFRHANGGWLACESAISVIFNQAGRPHRVLVSARDTQERLRAE
jgi:PAS domain S-box-containing protein